MTDYSIEHALGMDRVLTMDIYYLQHTKRCQGKKKQRNASDMVKASKPK
jgi:hypothetical protein